MALGTVSEVMSGRYWDEQLETLPVERRRLLREHRLCWQVRRCWDGSPFYRARLEAAGLDPTTFGGFADLPRISMLRSGDLPRDEESGQPASSWAVAPEAWWQDNFRAGHRLTRVLTDGDSVHESDLAARALWAAGGRPGRGLIFTSADVGDATLDAIEAGGRRIGMAIQTDSAGDAHVAAEPLAVALETNHDLTSTMTGSRSEPPDIAWTTSWPLPLHTAAPTLGALSLASVAPTLAYACGVGDGLHWADDHYLIETVDPVTGDTVGPGAPGGLVITDLAREGSPLLRFWIGLETTLIETPCPCGRTSARSPFVRPLA